MIIIVMIIQVGESPSLECDYSLAGENLYSIKWYKDQQEFYRSILMILMITIFMIAMMMILIITMIKWYKDQQEFYRPPSKT